MIKNYLKIAWRNLIKNRVYSTINILGLAIGMAGFILIGTWVWNELSFDQFHENKNSLYKVYNRAEGDGQIYTWDVTAGPLAKSLKQDFPEVKRASRIYWSTNRLFNLGDKNLKAKGNEVDKPFLQMFSFPLLKGDAAHALDDVSNIVLTEKLARKLFGDKDPMNQTVKLDNKNVYKVTGVMRDLPGNTEFDFEYLLSLQANESFYGDTWNNNSYYTYVQLQPNTPAEKFNEKIKGEILRYSPKAETEIFLYPITKWHLYSRFENGKAVGGRIEIIRLLLIIASLILCIACINFMNLSTAQSHKRAKEVGVRKVIGAGRMSLVRQFLTESFLIAVVASFFALLMVTLSLPAFNQLLGKNLQIAYSNPVFWLALTAFVLFTGFLAGSYPAFFLSAFKPVKVLKGRFIQMQGAINPRKILVVAQFAVAISLIIATMVIYRQIKFVQERNTGYNIDNLVEVPIEGDINKNYEVIKAELLDKGVVTAMCKTSLSVTVDGAQSSGFTWNGMNKDLEKISFSRFGTTGDFIKTMGLKLLAGRDIDQANRPADSNAVLLNASAIKNMQLKDPVGKTLKWSGREYTISGIFDDFIIGSPYGHVSPMIVMATSYWTYNTVLRFNGQKNMAQNLATAEKVFRKYNPAYPFTYEFVDKEHEKKLNDQKQTASLSAIFAGLTIFISCMGLFGLATHTAENRIKEIGIRKVLGASVTGITNMLTREFVWLVIIAIVIAVPVSGYLMNKWLTDFTYRIEIHWLTFAYAGCAAVFIAVMTVSFQAVKAAIANPVKSLRSE